MQCYSINEETVYGVFLYYWLICVKAYPGLALKTYGNSGEKQEPKTGFFLYNPYTSTIPEIQAQI